MIQMCHLVVGSTELETEHRQQVLPFQKYTTFQAVAKVDCMMEGSLIDDLVNAGCQDQSEILYGGE